MNIKEYKESKILFIKGVFIKDCIPLDDIFEQQILEKLNINTHILSYNKIPSNFVNNNTWIKNTNVKCWYCDLNFDNVPVFIPKIIEHSGINNTDYNIITFGCFCSFCCAVAYVDIYNAKICDNIKSKEMLKFLYMIFNGTSIKELLPSPNKYTMEHYGGCTSQVDYRSKINIIKDKMKELEYNIKHT
jgi:hypothetical protein